MIPLTPDYAEEVTNISLSRELWQPDRHEQLAAVEILLASPLPRETRVVIRELEQQIVRREIPELERNAA